MLCAWTALAVFGSALSARVVIKPTDTFEDFVRTMGFAVENHTAVASDGVELTLFRLPQPTADAPAVLLQHGILASAWCWVAHGDPERAVAFALHREGYDVWLSNSRGNVFSHAAVAGTPQPSSDAFWNFTFETMAAHDVPANIDYVLNATGRASLSFVAWSQGHTQFMQAALGAEGAALAAKINVYAALSPVVYLKHATSTFLTALAKLHLGGAIHAVYKRSFLDGPAAMHVVEELFCKLTLGAVCEFAVDVFCGSSAADDADLIENVAAHFPAGTSVKDLVHYAQYVNHGRFAKYDYGRRGNELAYNGSTAPPLFNLSAFPARLPVALFDAGDDALVARADREQHNRELNASASRPVVFNRIYGGFSHLTWFVGRPSTDPWLDDLTAVLARYSGVHD